MKIESQLTKKSWVSLKFFSALDLTNLRTIFTFEVPEVRRIFIPKKSQNLSKEKNKHT